MRLGASSSMMRERPGPPKFSLYSLQPVMPSSVSTLRKSKLRQPASACSDSIRVIFMARKLPDVGSRPQAKHPRDHRATIGLVTSHVIATLFRGAHRLGYHD